VLALVAAGRCPSVVNFISEGFARQEFLENPRFSAILWLAAAINRPAEVI
jgi:hypothetical protein